MANISETLLQRYYELSQTAKEVEKELKGMKKELNAYFDHIIGQNQKGESDIGEYKVQRVIRYSENFDVEKTVKRLEEKQLTDCIETKRIPDKEKINAAITLGLIDSNEIEDCIERKVSQAISVKKI
jgi:hypothetical protein